MSSISTSKIKISSATKRFNRYHPHKKVQLEEKLDYAETVLLWDLLDLPKLFDEKLDPSINLDNLKFILRQLKQFKIHLIQENHYEEYCYFKLLSDIIREVNVKKIQSIGISQEIDFESNLNSDLKQLFKTCHLFSKIFYQSPWRTLYPLLDEYLKINGTPNYLALWEFLEADFKIRFGNLHLKDYRLSLQYFEQNLAIVFIDYRIKAHSKSAPRLVQLKILLRMKLNVWQISELFSEDFFHI